MARPQTLNLAALLPPWSFAVNDAVISQLPGIIGTAANAAETAASSFQQPLKELPAMGLGRLNDRQGKWHAACAAAPARAW